nr:unnamed protein product [Callosobruchus chinensis]
MLSYYSHVYLMGRDQVANHFESKY